MDLRGRGPRAMALRSTSRYALVLAGILGGQFGPLLLVCPGIKAEEYDDSDGLLGLVEPGGGALGNDKVTACRASLGG